MPAVGGGVTLAPLHNPPALQAIHWLGRWQPGLDQWACFDTAFHASLPPEAATYAHTGRVAAARPPARRLPWPQPPARGRGHALPAPDQCSPGAGSSLAASRDCRSVDTTMGFTPLEGLVMASRSGSVDPGCCCTCSAKGSAWRSSIRG